MKFVHDVLQVVYMSADSSTVSCELEGQDHAERLDSQVQAASQSTIDFYKETTHDTFTYFASLDRLPGHGPRCHLCRLVAVVFTQAPRDYSRRSKGTSLQRRNAGWKYSLHRRNRGH